jgi:hypothetical protein
VQNLQFESSPFYIIICLLLGASYAFVLYRNKHTWSKSVNQFLFLIRTLLVTLLSFLLLGPIVKLTTLFYEKPTLVFLIDNSASIQESMDSLGRTRMIEAMKGAGAGIEKQGFEIVYKDLNNNAIQDFKFSNLTSDLNTAIRNVTTEYEGKNLAGMVLVTDGIYNNGASPLYSPIRVPIFTVGVGDTTDRADLVLKNVSYNKIAYQGNKFPVRAEVVVHSLPNQQVKISAVRNGKVISQGEQNTGTKQFLNFDFLMDATDKGTQRIDVVVEPMRGEASYKNNRTSFFVEVVEGRKKILMIAPAPHPDIKAIRSVVEKNANYEFILHIPGISEASQSLLKPGAAELIIFHQIADRANKTSMLYHQFKNGPASLLVLVGTQSNLRQLPSIEIPLNFESIGQWDEVTPSINTSFHSFNFPENSNGVFSRYPPIEVPFGKFSFPGTANVLLYQRIGSVITDRPLLLSWEDEKHKTAALVGEGIWRWRLSEFADSENTEVFDDVFLKLIQYLSTLEDKRKFRSFPIQNEFTDAVPVIIESQVYNDLFEPIFGNTIGLEVRGEKGEATRYQYTTSPGGTRYQIGGLKEGAYQFKASTEINGKREEVRGQFLVRAQNSEAQNLVADFGLLRKLATSTGGKFYTSNQLPMLQGDFQKKQAQTLIHTQETFNALINLKWFFFLLLVMISTEWFLRKYWGGY